jgi:hypothetical protein
MVNTEQTMRNCIFLMINPVCVMWEPGEADQSLEAALFTPTNGIRHLGRVELCVRALVLFKQQRLCMETVFSPSLPAQFLFVFSQKQYSCLSGRSNVDIYKMQTVRQSASERLNCCNKYAKCAADEMLEYRETHTTYVLKERE